MFIVGIDVFNGQWANKKNTFQRGTGFTLKEIGTRRTQSHRYQQLSIEAKERQAHGETAPGRTLTQKIEEPLFQKGAAAEIAAKKIGTNRHLSIN